MVHPIDPTATGFLLAENRNMPMHVGGLQLFEKPDDAPRDYARKLYETMSQPEEMSPLFLKRPTRGITTAGQWVWTEDDAFDLEYHFRHSALPKPGRVRELLELCSRLHSTRLAMERPLWEWHLIEGLRTTAAHSTPATVTSRPWSRSPRPPHVGSGTPRPLPVSVRC